MSPMNMVLASVAKKRKQICKWVENDMKNYISIKDVIETGVSFYNARLRTIALVKRLKEHGTIKLLGKHWKMVLMRLSRCMM